MRVKKLLFCFSLFTFSFSLLVNAQQKTLAVEISPGEILTCSAITETKDGGYLASGIGADHSGIAQSYLVKLDSNGVRQWSNLIGPLPNIKSTTNSFCNSITLSPDGGYVITGYTDIYNQSVPNVFVMKFDSAGNSLWSKNIGGIRGDIGYSIIQTADRGFAITGSASSFMLADTEVYVLKLDSIGNVLWTKTIGGIADNEGYSIIQTKDQGYAITGETDAYGAGGYDVYVIKLNSGGNLQWTKTIGGRKNDVGNSIIQSRDGGYAITGNTYSFNDTVNGDVYAIKLDSSGNLQWTRTIGGTNVDAGESIFQTREGDFAIGGYTSSYGDSGTNLYFVKFDSVGNLKQTYTYGGSINMENKPMIQTKSGGFAFVGLSSYGYLYLLVLDSAGNNCKVSGSGGIIGSGGTVSSGGHITLNDSGRVEPGWDTNVNTTGFAGTNIYLCRNNNNSGGLGVFPTVTSTNCLNGPYNGITLSVSGGVSPYTYTWTPSVSDSSSATGLSFGTYTISVTDTMPDTVTVVVTIRDDEPFEVYYTVSNTTCLGIANGSVSIIDESNYDPPYYFSWSNGDTATSTDGESSISGLSAGTYSVTVIDACSDTGTAVMRVGLTIDFSDSAIVINNESCYNESEGSASVSISGGTPPFTYQWSDANSQTTAVSTGLSAGIYTITVSDACGGPVTSSVTITQPFAFSVNIATSNPACFGESNGNAVASLTSPLIVNFPADTVVQHFLVPSSVSTITLTIGGAEGGNDHGNYGTPTGNGANFIGVCPVTPGHILSVVVGQQGTDIGGGGASWVYDSNIVLHSPSGTIGLLAVAAGGGGSGYSYGGYNRYSYVGGSGGINLVTNTTTIGSPAYVSAAGGMGGNGGDSVLYGAGGAGWLSNGAPGYRYGILGGMDEANHFRVAYEGGGFGGGGGGICKNMAGTGQCIGGGGGGYNGGAAGLGGGGGGSFFIDTLPKVSDSGTGNGFVRIEYIITGYDSTFTYSWSNGESTINATGLSAGTYSLTVTNSNGCSATTSVTITQPATAPGISIFSVTNLLCNGGNTGSVTANAATGGTSPYTYLWNDANTQTSLTATGLSSGMYIVIVLDNGGCSASATAIITQPAAIVPTINETTPINCYGDSDGAIFATASGGTGFYAYSWSDAFSQTNALATGLSAGTYSVIVTDNNGCNGTAGITITQPSILSLVADSSADFGTCDGSAWAVVNGGTNPYTYSWNPSGLATDTIANQCSGDYCCTVTDANGCLQSVCVNIPTSTGTNEVKGESEKVKVYPNPNNGVFTIVLGHAELARPDESVGRVSASQPIIEIYDVLGEKIYFATLKQVQPARTGTGGGDNLINLSDKPDGMYFYRVLSEGTPLGKENGGLVGEGKIIIQR